MKNCVKCHRLELTKVRFKSPCSYYRFLHNIVIFCPIFLIFSAYASQHKILYYDLDLIENVEKEHEEIEEAKKSTPIKRHFSAEKRTLMETLNIMWMNKHSFAAQDVLNRKIQPGLWIPPTWILCYGGRPCRNRSILVNNEMLFIHL